MDIKQSLEQLSKYYTPSIEEFRVGFEYEENCEYGEYPDQYDEWECKTIDFAIEINEIEKALEISRIRVKYLDKEDIESCGFRFESEGFYIWSKYKKGGGSIGLYYTIDTLNVDIVAMPYRRSPYNFFSGKIKNLSELKQLLKQLGIDE